MGKSRRFRRWRAIAVTLLTASLLYMSAVLWAVWSSPPFDLSSIDTGRAASLQSHDGSVAWPIAATTFACGAVVLTTVAWRRTRKSADRSG